jgi:hypothetical protein
MLISRPVNRLALVRETTRNPEMFARRPVISSVIPAVNGSSSGPPVLERHHRDARRAARCCSILLEQLSTRPEATSREEEGDCCDGHRARRSSRCARFRDWSSRVERREEIADRPAIGGDSSERARDRGIDGGQHAFSRGTHRSRKLSHPARKDRLRRRSCERGLSDQHLVRHAGQAVQIALLIERGLGRRLFGTHVRWGAEGDARDGELLSSRLGDRAGDAEVGDDGVTALEENVLRLDVAVQHSTRVRVDERVGHLSCDAERLVHAELPPLAEPIAERASFGVRRDIVKHGIAAIRHRGFPGVEQGQDVGVRQPRRYAHLPQKATGPDRRAEFRLQHLQRDLTIVPKVVGEVDDRHPADAEFALDAEAIGEHGARRQVGHTASMRSRTEVW